MHVCALCVCVCVSDGALATCPCSLSPQAHGGSVPLLRHTTIGGSSSSWLPGGEQSGRGPGSPKPHPARMRNPHLSPRVNLFSEQAATVAHLFGLTLGLASKHELEGKNQVPWWERSCFLVTRGANNHNPSSTVLQSYGFSPAGESMTTGSRKPVYV